MNNSSFFHILPTVTAVAMSFGSELWSSQSDTQAFFNSYTNIRQVANIILFDELTLYFSKKLY